MALSFSTQKAVQLLYVLVFAITSAPCLSQSLALDKRSDDNAKIRKQYQAELARAGDLVNQNPLDAPLLFAYAQSLEKVSRLMDEQGRRESVSPYENAIRAIKSLTQGQLNSGPILAKGAGYEAAVKLYDDAERLQGYWVAQLVRRHELTHPAESKNYASRALKIYQDLVVINPKNTQWQAAFITAKISTLTGQRQSVHTNFQSTLDLILRLVDENPKDAHLQRALAAVYARKGSLLVSSASSRGYVEEWKKEIDVRVGLLNQDEDNNINRAELAAALERSAESYAVMGGGERAYLALTDAKKLREELIQREPENSSRQHDLMAVNRALADVRDRHANVVKKVQATYLNFIESSLRADQASASDIALARDTAFKTHEDNVEQIYRNILQTSLELVKKTPDALLAQRALVDSYTQLGDFYLSRTETISQASKLYADGAESLRQLSLQNSADVGWLFYQIELNIALGWAYGAELSDNRSAKRSELLALIPGDELKAEKDRRYLLKEGDALRAVGTEPAHLRHAALNKAADAIYEQALQLVQTLLDKTPASAEIKNGPLVAKRREF